MENASLLSQCSECDERRYADEPVPGEGNLSLAKIALLGRNPGRTEDFQKRPFVGRAGEKLNNGLVYGYILRRDCYITNLSKCMTPAGVIPTPGCRRTCAMKWLNAEFRALERNQLKLVVSLGNEALRYFEPAGSVGMLHGTHFDTDKPWTVGTFTGKICLFVSYHPSAALRSTSTNEKFMGDMQKLGVLVKEMGL